VRQGQLPNVEVEVEPRVVYPVGVIQAERNLGQPPAQRRQQGKPFEDQSFDVGQGESTAGRRRRIEYRESRHVPALPRVLERQELRVEARELAHRRSVILHRARPIGEVLGGKTASAALR